MMWEATKIGMLLLDRLTGPLVLANSPLEHGIGVLSLGAV